MPLNLRLLQIADSALPISGYTHSWGLEAAVARGQVNGPEALERWVGHWLRSSLGPLEGVLAASACRQADDPPSVAELNDIMEASVAPPTLRTASREMGEQLMALGSTWSWSASGVARFLHHRKDGWHHPVAFGLLGAFSGAGPQDVLTAYLHQAALGLVSAGVRAIPVGHTHGQQVLAYLHDGVAELVEQLSARGPDTAGASCPYYEIICDEQTRLYARMFRS
jgi:urease accessory protein